MSARDSPRVAGEIRMNGGIDSVAPCSQACMEVREMVAPIDVTTRYSPMRPTMMSADRDDRRTRLEVFEELGGEHTSVHLRSLVKSNLCERHNPRLSISSTRALNLIRGPVGVSKQHAHPRNDCRT